MRELKARDGCVWTNGEIYSDMVYLSVLEDISDWEEITVEEADRRQEELLNDEIMV